MDPPRRPTGANDPKIRHVGFFAPGRPPDRTQSVPAGSPSSSSPSGNSLLSPVMIIPPPARHASDNLSRAVNVPTANRTTPFQPRRRSSDNTDATLIVGSYNPEESVLGTSPASTGIGTVDGEFSEDRENLIARTNSGLSGGRFEPMASAVAPAGHSNMGMSSAGKSGEEAAEVVNEVQRSKKPLKEKTTKAERRALQEAQRAAKGLNPKTSAAPSTVTSVQEQTSKNLKQPSRKKEIGLIMPSSAASEKKGSDRPADKDRKKDAPAPRMQFDDKSRVEKAKRRSLVKQTEARNIVELFRHLPQYEHGTQLPDLESRFFQLDPMHPSVYKGPICRDILHFSPWKVDNDRKIQVGLQYLAGDVVGGNERCIAMLQAFQDAIKDYSTPPEKTLSRDLTAKINSYVSFLIECRPLSISMGNAIRFLKARIAKSPLTLPESEAKASLCSDIERYINEKILLADKVIVGHAVTKIRDGDVLLTYGSSSIIEMILLHAFKLGKRFRVVVVDSRPKLEGQALVRRLVRMGLSCTYTHINAVSYIMHEVTRVLLGAASVLSNGTVYSRVGSACISMVAHAFLIPVLICCEAYKFHERVQLDSICSNELGDPDAISMVPGSTGVDHLDNYSNKENLQLLNLVYDATPSDYISMIITEYGMIPTTSVPVIVREYGREHLLM